MVHLHLVSVALHGQITNFIEQITKIKKMVKNCINQSIIQSKTTLFEATFGMVDKMENNYNK
jgi:hypothetical protein